MEPVAPALIDGRKWDHALRAGDAVDAHVLARTGHIRPAKRDEIKLFTRASNVNCCSCHDQIALSVLSAMRVVLPVW